MTDLHITTRGAVKVENNIPVFVEADRNGINNIYLLTEDTHVVYDRTNKHYELNGKAGDILIVFYESIMKTPIILVESKDWADNIIAYAEEEQKRKEEWASKRAAGDNSK